MNTAQKLSAAVPLITIAENELIKSIHHRMPVVIDKQYYDKWLDKQASPKAIRQLLTTDAYQRMTIKPVSDWVNNPQHNDKNYLN